MTVTSVSASSPSSSSPAAFLVPRSSLLSNNEAAWREQITSQHIALTQMEQQIRSLLSTLSEQRRAIAIDQHRHACTRAVYALKSRIQQLETCAQEQDTDQDTQTIETMLEKHRIIEQDLSASIGRTLLACQRAMALQSAADRKELLEADSQILSRRLQQHASETALDKSREFGERLRQTKSVLADQIKQSEEALKHLASSTSVMSSTGKETEKYASTVASSAATITRQKRREMTDRILMWVCVICFCLVVAYIWKKRVGRFFFNPLHIFNTISQAITGTTTPTSTSTEYTMHQHQHQQQYHHHHDHTHNEL